MIKKIPRYLKLHVEEEGARSVPPVDELPALSGLCDSFTQATGWPLHFERAQASDTDVVWQTEIGGEGMPLWGSLYVARRELQQAPVKRARWPLKRECVEPLANSLGEILQELCRLRHAVWKREAELATGIPVAVRKEEQEHLAERLEAVLRGGAEAIGCQAAALYLLDDTTSQLKLRACWGLPKERLLEEARPLRGAVADLEALVGHAVVLEDTELLPHWKVPEPFASAVCVPVSSPSNPLGTLWVFCDRQRDYTAEETNLIEIVAGRIVADLEREVLLTEGVRSRKLAQQLQFASHWQINRLPTFAPLVHGWSVAGWNRQADMVGGDFYDWSILPDGMMSIAVGDAEGKLLEAALTASIVQTSLKSHGNYRHNAKQMVDRVNETLWSASAGDQFASLFYAKINAESGHVEFCSGGRVSAYRISASGVERINTDAAPLGSQPESVFKKMQLTLKVGQLLLVASEGTRELLDKQQRPQLEAALDYCRRNPDKAADEYVDAIGQPFESPEGGDRTIVVVKRHV